MSFEILPGHPASSCVIHVPHSSRSIPPDVHGSPLRDPAPVLLPRYFDPYAEALADIVDARLEATGRALLVDLHSYPVAALPYELHQRARRPVVCLGVDDHHTPAALLARAGGCFADVGDVAVDEPFVGTYVPLRHHGVDGRVTSVMIELRRDSYLDEDGSLSAARAARVVTALAALV